MPAKRHFLSLCILFAAFCFWVDSSSAGTGRGSHARSSSEGVSAGNGLWKTFPEGGGYFQQRSDAPVIVIPTPPRLPAPGVLEGAATGQHGRIPQERVVPSFIPDEAVATGAFSGGL